MTWHGKLQVAGGFQVLGGVLWTLRRTPPTHSDFLLSSDLGFWTPTSQIRAGEGLMDDLDLALSVWGLKMSPARGEETERRLGRTGDRKEKSEGRRRKEQVRGGGRAPAGERRREGCRGEGRGRGGLPSVILSSEEEERMRKQEIGFKGR